MIVRLNTHTGRKIPCIGWGDTQHVRFDYFYESTQTLRTNGWTSEEMLPEYNKNRLIPPLIVGGRKIPRAPVYKRRAQ